MTTPVAIAERFGLPHHGNVVSGVLVLPNGKAIDYPQPNGAGTVVVHGNNRPTITRTAAQTALDAAAGNTWIDYAYLSGLNLQIGGVDIGEEPDEYYPPQRFIYSDDKHAWICHWDCTTWRFINIEPVITIKVQKLFGAWGYVDTPTSLDLTVFDGPLHPSEEWYEFGVLEDAWLYGYQSATGDKLVIQRPAVWRSYDGENLLPIYPWRSVGDDEYPGNYYHVFLVEDRWSLFQLAGNGSVVRGSIGTGITCTRADYGYFPWSDPPTNNVSQIWKTITADGDLDTYQLDETNHLTARTCRVTNTRGTVDITISSDWEDPTHAGVKVVEGGCYFEVWEVGQTVPRRIHIQAGSLAPDNTGRTYDVMNDVWYPTGCVV